MEKSYGFGAFEDDMLILKKFILSEKLQQPVKIFAGPEVPANFNFMHKLESSDSHSELLTKKHGEQNDSMNMYLRTASSRAEILGEESIRPDSVLDLISPADREFLIEQKRKLTSKSTEVIASNESIQEARDKRYKKFTENMKNNFKGC